ncbi:MAG: small GTP-binding protein [Mariniblastus sp.]
MTFLSVTNSCQSNFSYPVNQRPTTFIKLPYRDVEHVSEKQPHQDSNYLDAIKAVEKTLADLRGCPDAERERLKNDIFQLNEMYEKVTTGRVEIVIFGEISTGKSALVNALIGRAVAEVDVQGGWTKQVWGTAWEGAGHRLPGLDSSEVVIVDTPGINEVGGAERAELADVTARRADLILFVTDSDLNDTEYAALVELAAVQKPIICVFNKIDLYPTKQKEALTSMIKARLDGLIPPEHFVQTVADPREIEYVIEQPDGSSVTEWRKPGADVGQLKSIILETLEKEGLGLIALNAAMYAADKSDRIATMRVEMRNRQADQVIWTMAATKAVVVAANPIPGFDVIGGLAVDAIMIATLSKVYGLSFSMSQARGLAKTISAAGGLYALGELVNYGASLFKLASFSFGTALTLIPQGAAVGFGSYIIGKTAKHYFEHGGSWGGNSAKSVVKEILASTDKDSVVSHLKDEIRKKLDWNRHAKK